MITIYHNPHCSKSRAACDLIVNFFNVENEPVEVVEYLKHPLTLDQLKTLNGMLGGSVRDMLRESEAEYKQMGLENLTLTDDELYQAIERHPVLLQRPIVMRNGKAVIGRPPENVRRLFPPESWTKALS